MLFPRDEQSHPPPSDHIEEPSPKRRKTVSFSEYVELRVIDATNGSLLSSEARKMRNRRDGLPDRIEREFQLIDRRLKILLSRGFLGDTLAHNVPAVQNWTYYAVTELLNHFLRDKQTARHMCYIARKLGRRTSSIYLALARIFKRMEDLAKEQLAEEKDDYDDDDSDDDDDGDEDDDEDGDWEDEDYEGAQPLPFRRQEDTDDQGDTEEQEDTDDEEDTEDQENTEDEEDIEDEEDTEIEEDAEDQENTDAQENTVIQENEEKEENEEGNGEIHGDEHEHRAIEASQGGLEKVEESQEKSNEERGKPVGDQEA
ncbi:uncharacterized protein C8A04DRAFT_27362 [Dichotomopilus funicola]|uniref:Uncharacterized protein n=1 Tax=Dichotomopilus funicola TaxID=1934379 RepID=A0AAN6ZP53_9PEZI|nr:hypothetical protein C8A04DRAFT_27362 [Dichotomopilus funicola]